VVLAVALAACGSSGREMAEPEPGATAPPRKPPAAGTAPASSTTLASFFALTTDAWTPAAEIPARFTCDGPNVSPPLVLSKIPEGTAELAIVVTDPDAGGFVHWVLAGIPPDTTTLAEGQVPAGAVQAANSAGGTGWFGPCPPAGDGSHTYEFALLALSAPSGVTDGEPAEAAIARIEPLAIARAMLTGTYER
jgi:Raf kinase inhibitor-like YbhB/YbcL family protein